MIHCSMLPPNSLYLCRRFLTRYSAAAPSHPLKNHHTAHHLASTKVACNNVAVTMNKRSIATSPATMPTISLPRRLTSRSHPLILEKNSDVEATDGEHRVAGHGGSRVKVAGEDEGLDMVVESKARANKGGGGVRKVRSAGVMGGGTCGGGTKGVGWRRFCRQ